MQKKTRKKLSYRIRKKFTKLYLFSENIFVFLFSRIVFGSKLTKLPSSISGYYNFVSRDKFIKILLRKKEFIKEEISNLEILLKNFLPAKEIIPNYTYKNYFCGLILVRISDRMEAMDNEESEYHAACEFLNFFRKYAKKDFMEISKMPCLQIGLKIIQTIPDQKLYQTFCKEIEEILSKNQYSIGPSHGDFHSKNFLRKNSKNYLIDFDCFRKSSIQELDAIYFIIQKIIDDNPGIWWYEAIQIFEEKLQKTPIYSNFLHKFVALNDISDLKLIYFIDRIGQDSKYFKGGHEIASSDIIQVANELYQDLLQKA